MHDDRAQLAARLRRARLRVAAEIVAAEAPCSAHATAAGGEIAVEAALEQLAEAPPIAAGDAWGPPWSTTWFALAGPLPASWDGRRVELEVDLGFDAHQPGFQAEGLAYDERGRIVKGVHPRNATVPLAQLAEPGAAEVRCLVEAVAIPPIMGDRDHHFAPTPLGARATAGTAPLYRFGGARLVAPDDEVRALGFDLEVLHELTGELAADHPRCHEILAALERAVDVLDRAGVAAGAGAARAELAETLAAPAERGAHRITAVGHAHIDSAWLWPLAETPRKCARTFSSVLSLLESEAAELWTGEEAGSPGGLVFACSQAQQWEWVRERHPELFARMTAAGRAGRFVPVGGMWVESDTNLPSGESLVRQLVWGKRFFLEHVGVECEEVWLPDAFGYSASLPQLIALAGSRWFLSQKLSWNDTNRFPHHSFWWEGIDGTRIFAHFPPVATYNAVLSPAELARARRGFAESGRARRSLVPFGYGDGGGGPTAEMLERGRRQRDLEGSPRCSPGSPAEFFAAAEAEYPGAPVYAGELYLEKHRGTLTSQARLKALNRRCEHLLHEAELWCTTASCAGLAEYPFEDLERLWKQVLLQQFHDILPGSSIAEVNDEATRALSSAASELERLVADALGALAGEGDEPLAFNACPFERRGVAALGWGRADEPGGAVASAAARDGGGAVLRNGHLVVELGADGLIASLVDVAAGRELVPPGGRANLLQVHPDHPAQWDAWDLDAAYRRGADDVSALDELAVVEEDPDEAVVRCRRSFGASRVTQHLRLRRGERALRIETELDWHEHERIVKLAFPLDLHVQLARAEIQFGHLAEPLTANTSFEAARFEQRCHRFVHLAEGGEEPYGVAVVNDAVYGHDLSRNARPGGGLTTTLRCSLVRGPRFPDPRADAGVHRFAVELHPGATLAGAVAAGYACNLPLRQARGSAAPVPVVALEPAAPGAAPPSGFVVETVKAADDRSGDVVVRCYEALGGRARARLRPAFPLAGAEVADLLERPLAALEPDSEGRLDLGLRPFQVLTLRLRRR